MESVSKNTPLIPYSDSFLAASIISRFESGLFCRTTLSNKIFWYLIVTHFLITIFFTLYVRKLECVFRRP